MSVKQCPHCGGYKVLKFEPNIGWSSWGLTAAFFATLATWGIALLILVPWAIVNYRKKANDPWFQYGYHCELCGYEWQQKPGEVLPINEDLELVKKGTLKLEEEERERKKEVLDSWAAWQQMKK